MPDPFPYQQVSTQFIKSRQHESTHRCTICTLSKGLSPLIRALKYPAANNSSMISSNFLFCSSSSLTSNWNQQLRTVKRAHVNYTSYLLHVPIWVKVRSTFKSVECLSFLCLGENRHGWCWGWGWCRPPRDNNWRFNTRLLPYFRTVERRRSVFRSRIYGLWLKLVYSQYFIEPRGRHGVHSEWYERDDGGKLD